MKKAHPNVAGWASTHFLWSAECHTYASVLMSHFPAFHLGDFALRKWITSIEGGFYLRVLIRIEAYFDGRGGIVTIACHH